MTVEVVKEEKSGDSIQNTDGQPTGGGYTGYQRDQRKPAKEGIAKYVVKNIIKPATSIFLDAGSTVHQVGHQLFQSDIVGLTIMTNNMLVFNEFTREGLEFERGNILSLTGGVYNQSHEALFGEAVETVLKEFHPRVVVIGASGFVAVDDPSFDKNSQGAFNHDIVAEGSTKKAIARRSTFHRVIVCDHSKIGFPDSSCFATIEQLSENTKECSIITSILDYPELKDPELSKDKRKDLTEEIKAYQELFKVTKAAVDKLSKHKVKMIMVDHEGKPVA